MKKLLFLTLTLVASASMLGRCYCMLQNGLIEAMNAPCGIDCTMACEDEFGDGAMPACYE